MLALWNEWNLEDRMSGTLRLIRSIGNLFVIGYPLSSLLYFMWGLSMKRIVYWDGYNVLNGVIIFLIIAGFVPFSISLFVSDLQTGWRILASLFVFPLLCCSAFFWMDLPFYKQVNEMQFDRHKYLLTYHNSIYGEGAYDWYLFECARAGILCKATLLYSDEYGEFYNDSSLTSLVIDEDVNELHVVIDNDLLYTVGHPSREYIVMARSAQRGKYGYNLSQYKDPHTDSLIFNLYECDAQFKCARLPFVYSVPGQGVAASSRLFVEIDETTHDVHVIRQSASQNAELIFSYGDRPHCHVEECSIPDD